MFPAVLSLFVWKDKGCAVRGNAYSSDMCTDRTEPPGEAGYDSRHNDDSPGTSGDSDTVQYDDPAGIYRNIVLLPEKKKFLSVGIL